MQTTERAEEETSQGEGDDTEGVAEEREVGAQEGRQETGEEGQKREGNQGRSRAMHEQVLPQKRKQDVGEATEKGTSRTLSSEAVQSKWTAVEAAEAVADPDMLLPPSPKKQRQQCRMRGRSQMGRQTAGRSDERRGEGEKGEDVESEEREREGKEKGEGSGDGATIY